jgi:hypothetical protein
MLLPVFLVIYWHPFAVHERLLVQHHVIENDFAGFEYRIV